MKIQPRTNPIEKMTKVGCKSKDLIEKRRDILGSSMAFLSTAGRVASIVGARIGCLRLSVCEREFDMVASKIVSELGICWEYEYPL